MTRKLEHEMRRGAESREPERGTVQERRQAKRRPSNRAGTDERRRIRVGENSRNRVGEISAERDVLRVASAHFATGGAELRAKILQPGATPASHPICRLDPRDAATTT